MLVWRREKFWSAEWCQIVGQSWFVEPLDYDDMYGGLDTRWKKGCNYVWLIDKAKISGNYIRQLDSASGQELILDKANISPYLGITNCPLRLSVLSRQLFNVPQSGPPLGTSVIHSMEETTGLNLTTWPR